MSQDALQTAGVILVVFPTVIWGGVTVLWVGIVRPSPLLSASPLRRRLWIAGHAHAGVLLVLSLVALLLLQYADLSDGWRVLVRWAFPGAAILLSAAFFLSVLREDAERPNRLIALAFAGAALLAAGMIALGVGLLRAA
jgi:hypothetical protein